MSIVCCCCVHIRYEVFGKKCFKYTRQVCCSTRINRLLDLERSTFNSILVLQREIEKQDNMFKFLILCGCLLALANVGVFGGLIAAPAPIILKPTALTIAPAPIALKPAALTIAPAPLALKPATLTIAPAPLALKPATLTIAPAPIAAPILKAPLGLQWG